MGRFLKHMNEQEKKDYIFGYCYRLGDDMGGDYREEVLEFFKRHRSLQECLEFMSNFEYHHYKLTEK